MLNCCTMLYSETISVRGSIKRTTLVFLPSRSFFFTASWLALNLASYQLTKQMSSFSKKLCFVCSCFECKLSKLPFTTMSQPTTENIYTTPHECWLACDKSPCYVLQKVSLKKQIQWSRLAQRSVPWLHVSIQNSVVSRQNSRGWKAG